MIIGIGGLAFPAATETSATAATTQQVPGIDALAPSVTSWSDVTAAGKAFVGVEAAQGATITNSQYASVVTGATGAGLYVMPYVFADPAKVDGAGQFDKAWAVISAVPAVPYARGGLMLPVALDMETDSINFPTEPCYGLTVSGMVSWIQAFINEARAKTGAIPVLYSNPNWWKLCTNNTTAFGGAPLWIANYGVSSPAVPPGWYGYTFWQSSDQGSVNGISNTVDLDQMQGAPSVVYAAAGSNGHFQVQTLNGLAGQAVTYSAPSPGTGMSVSSTGVFSWTSAAVGSYPVTVTPSGPSTVFPSAVSFTFDVHGAITVISPGNKTTTAGSPAYLRINTSGPDQNAGFKPTLTASGLPTGLSMDSSGLITGWPSKPGTFKITVSASDALHGTGSMSFTWTVSAAANSGFAGAIRQVGGTGKCLNEPSSSPANGTAVDLWTCTGLSNQKWTIVQDGTIRVLGKCLDVVGESKSNGAKLQLWSCNSGDGAQQWQAGTGGELINPQSGKCLYVPVTSAANGTRPVINGCANVANDHWSRPAANIYSGVPNRCITVSGTSVVYATCANVAAQHWTASADGTFRLGSQCLAEAGSTSGSGLVIGSCSGATATKWKLAGAGPIATTIASAASGLCVTFPSSGTRLVIKPCTTGPASTWHIM